MACKKTELVAAINSFGAARASGDPNLIAFAVNMIGQFIDTLEFAPEEPAEQNSEKTEPETEVEAE
jgi:hypothetical protein